MFIEFKELKKISIPLFGSYSKIQMPNVPITMHVHSVLQLYLFYC